MEYLEILITGIGVIVVILILIGGFIIKNKSISLRGGEIMGLQFDIEERAIDKLEIVTAPIAASKGEILTPYLKIKVLDKNGVGIENKKVRLEFYNSMGLMSVKKISGTILKYSDKMGYVEFDDISLKESGMIEIYIISDGIKQSIDSVDIFPPGLCIDYWNEEVGSEKYIEKLRRALNFTQSGKMF